MDLFIENVELLRGSAFSNISKNESFIFLEASNFLAEYIVPTVTLDKFDLVKAEELFKAESENDKLISYYVHEKYNEDYSILLKKLDSTLSYTDIYLLKTLEKPYDISQEGILEEVTDDNQEAYYTLAKECFPEWGNEEEYTKYFYSLSKSNSEKVFKSFALILKGEMVSFGSVIVDTNLNLAYIHNSGTREAYRKKGYFSTINKYMCNFALNQGVKRVYSIVAENEGSFFAYKTLGFVEQERFFNYS